VTSLFCVIREYQARQFEGAVRVQPASNLQCCPAGELLDFRLLRRIFQLK
jgi:hypothetical protein